MAKIGNKFLRALQGGRIMRVKFRWGETFQGETDWTDWEIGELTFHEDANPENEAGVNIKGISGWGYASREKELEETYGAYIFGRYRNESNQHLLQVQFMG